MKKSFLLLIFLYGCSDYNLAEKSATELCEQIKTDDSYENIHRFMTSNLPSDGSTELLSDSDGILAMVFPVKGMAHDRYVCAIQFDNNIAINKHVSFLD